MSESAIEELTREELVARVRELEDAVDDLRELSGRRGADVNRRLSDIEVELEDLQNAVSHHGEQLEAVANVGEKKTDKEGKIAAIAAFAMQKADDTDAKVLVDAGEIRGCVGVARRYAYTLMDSIGGLDEDGGDGGFEDGKYQWAAVRKAQTVTTGNGPRQKKKALKVDCDRLRKSAHAPDGVSKLTTRTDEEGR